eukprot:gene14829-14964_t
MHMKVPVHRRKTYIQQAISGFLACLGLVWVSGFSLLHAETIRIGLQKTGTFAWELDVIRAHGLDKQAGLTLETTDLATTEAGKIALTGGSVDLILSDWLWVSRERGLGQPLAFYPYSSAIGAVMVADKSEIHALADLKGKSLGIAGGPLDKSWLLLQAFAKKSNIDIAHEPRIVFGAPPLLSEKAAQGELDATLQFWNFCADLEQRGFHRLIDLQQIEKGLGAKDNVAMVGYVFNEAYAGKNAETLKKFFAITRQAKEILKNDEAEWAPILARMGQKSPAALAIYRQRYSEGIPHRSLDEEESDARLLYQTLAATGGVELVGSAPTLEAGTFYKLKP